MNILPLCAIATAWAIAELAASAHAACRSASTPQCPSGCARDVPIPCPAGTADCCKTATYSPARTCYQYHDSGYLNGGSFIVPTGGSYPGCPSAFTSTGTCSRCSAYSCPFGGNPIDDPDWCYCNTNGYRRTCSKALACPRYTNGGCAICADRFYKDLATGRCATCTAGHRCVGGTKSACPAGTYSAAGAAACTPCRAGAISAAGSATCSVCAGNTYAADGATKCLACPATSTCASGINRACAAGTYTDENHTDCTPCPPGHKCIGGEKTACAAGTYQDQPAQAACTPCAAAAQDSYRDGCGGTSAGAVKPCTGSCPRDTFLTGRCAAGATADTSACASCAARAADRCLAGQYLGGCGGGARTEEGGACAACAHALSDPARRCPAGQHLARACGGGGLSDTSRCEPCAQCAAGSYTKGCSGASAGACAACVACDAATQDRVGCGGDAPGQCRTICARLGNATHPWFEAAQATPDRDRECRPCADFASAAPLMRNNSHHNETEPTDASRAWMRVCYRAPPPVIPPAAPSTTTTDGAFERYCGALGFAPGADGLQASATCIGATAGGAALVAAGAAALLLVWGRRRRKRAVSALARAHHAEMSELDDRLECAENMCVNPMWGCRTPGDKSTDAVCRSETPEANAAAIAELELRAMAASQAQDKATLKGLQSELRRLKREKQLGLWAPTAAKPAAKKKKKKGREFQATSIVSEEGAAAAKEEKDTPCWLKEPRSSDNQGWTKLKDPASGRD